MFDIIIKLCLNNRIDIHKITDHLIIQTEVAERSDI